MRLTQPIMSAKTRRALLASVAAAAFLAAFHASAVTFEPVVWAKYNNTIPSNSDPTAIGGRIPLGTSGKGDETGAAGPVLNLVGNTHQMSYSGSSSGTSCIYHARQVPPPGTFVTVW